MRSLDEKNIIKSHKNMKKFTFVQKVRNKIRVSGDLVLDIAQGAKIVHCDISVQGKGNHLFIGEGSVLRHTQIEIIGENSSIEIGKNSIIGHGSYLSAKEGKKLIIGDGCMLSRNARLMTSDGHFIYKNGQLINRGSDIVLKNNVWLADNVTVLKGVSMGDGSIAGINSTVTKDVVSKSIVAGNPAKLIQSDIESWQH